MAAVTVFFVLNSFRLQNTKFLNKALTKLNVLKYRNWQGLRNKHFGHSSFATSNIKTSILRANLECLIPIVFETAQTKPYSVAKYFPSQSSEYQFLMSPPPRFP